MDKIVIIGANDFQNPLILKAKDMGYETHVFAWQDGSIGEKTADFFYPISIVEKEAILEECKKIKPQAVVTIASDLAAVTVQYVAKGLGLNCNSDHCIKVSTNKYAMRKAFRDYGVATPKFLEVGKDTNLADLSDFDFPVIVKPTDRSGSRGITKVESFDDLKIAVDTAVDYSFDKKAIVEEYIDGNEYSCECISYHGKHNFLAITKKFTTGAPNFIETGQMEPSDLSDEQIVLVKEEIFKALDALEITNGASHSEFKINSKGQVRIIEIGARMGGDCIGSSLVHLSTGYDFVKMVIQVGLNQEPVMIKDLDPKPAIIKFIFNQDDLDNFNYIKNNYYDKINYVSEIEEVGSHEVIDSSSRFGFYILTCQNVGEARRLTKL